MDVTCWKTRLRYSGGLQQKEYEERLSKLDEVLSQINSLDAELKEENRKLKLSERKIADLTVKLKYANKNRFGDKSHSEKNDKAKNDEKWSGFWKGYYSELWRNPTQLHAPLRQWRRGENGGYLPQHHLHGEDAGPIVMGVSR